jgi:hypothetical protein
MVVDDVTVTPIGRGKSSVEITDSVSGPVHGNVIGQRRVYTHNPGAQVTDRRSVKMSDLIAGVHPGIGTARTHQINCMVRNLCHRCRQFRFHRSNTGFLELPAVKPTPIIFEGKCDAARAYGVIGGELLSLEKQVRIRREWFYKNKAPTLLLGGYPAAGACYLSGPIITDQDRFLRRSCASAF